MKELVILSGKGGTGKTSLAAAFACLADYPVVADCDVDAANLHLLLSPVVRETGEYFGGHEARIRPEDCTSCGLCATLCRFGAVAKIDGRFAISNCEGCGVCVAFCPAKAIDWTRALTGTWMVSDARTGTMVDARLRPGAENSGKLVARVRDLARQEASKRGSELVIVDGPPGIGCAAIASLTGADAALIVTEPTPSGIHDLERILGLTRHFGIDTQIVINKANLNHDQTQNIWNLAGVHGWTIAGTLPYSPLFTQSQLEGLPIPIRFPDSSLDKQIRELWKGIEKWIRS